MNTADEPLPQRVLAALAAAREGRGTTRGFVSGAALGASLGTSRSAVWKAIAALRALGVAIESLPRQGYRLVLPCSPLSEAHIRAALPPAMAARLRTLRMSWSTTSTNADALAAGAPPSGHFDLHVAEHQSAGRGRRGRSWLAPPGGALCLSWSWRFEALPREAGSLSLVVGLAAIRTLARLGHHEVRLKWPNDLLAADGKLAGILIELVSEAGGPALVVVGIGLNVALGPGVRAQVAASGNRVCDLHSLPGPLPDRNRLAALLAADGIDALLRWEREGFAPLKEEWSRHDALAGQPIVLRTPASELQGIARGVDDSGALLLDDGTRVHHCASGEASVRTRA